MSRQAIRWVGDELAAHRAFQEAPNIGPAMADDLVRLGFRRVSDLACEDGTALYARLCALDGVTHDICVCDVLEATVQYARTGEARPWWEYSRARKAHRAAK